MLASPSLTEVHGYPSLDHNTDTKAFVTILQKQDITFTSLNPAFSYIYCTEMLPNQLVVLLPTRFSR